MEDWQKEKYLLLAQSERFKKKVQFSIEIINQALKKGGIWGVSCSGGKDSIALLHLCYSAGWRGPVLHFRYDETPTENTALVQKMAKQLSLELHLLKVPGAWEVFEKAGRFFVVPETPEEKKLVNEMLNGYKKAINSYVESQGWTGQFLGLKMSESRARGFALYKKGYLYQTADRKTWTCCPLAKWTSADVWAYTMFHELPYLSCYVLSDDPERERSEITWLAAESLWRHGMAARLKRQNPVEFQKLAAKYPEIRYYV